MLENASLMARFASLVYLPEEELKIKLSQMGYDKFHWIDIEDTQAMIIPPYQDNQLVICFRGTEPDQLTDVLAYLKAWRKPSKEKGLVHYGFVEALDKVFLDIEYYLETQDINLENNIWTRRGTKYGVLELHEFEETRNNAIAIVQGNRNPFIDNPYLATLIWNGPSRLKMQAFLNNSIGKY